jgi:hypothetical protein
MIPRSETTNAPPHTAGARVDVKEPSTRTRLQVLMVGASSCCINSEDFKNYWAGWQSIATIAAWFIGGFWTWRRFFQFREGTPKIALNLEVNFIRKQSNKWIVTVEASLENRSKVRYRFKNFTFEIRYTLPSDELENKIIKAEPGRKGKVEKDITLSANFPNSAATGSWLDDAEHPDDRLDYGH